MKRILIFACVLMTCISGTWAASRNDGATSRTKSDSVNQTTVRTVATRNATNTTTTARNATQSVSTRATQTNAQSGTTRSASTRRDTSTARNATPTRLETPRNNTIVSRATMRNAIGNISRVADSTSLTTAQTRTGAEYEQCKNAFFTCMDQFCQLKNDDYRRCSCSNRVESLAESRAVLQDAGQQLTVFNENLDVVGMTAAQATAMKTASEGENALTSDTSASKALLQAIMNSIRGEDVNVGGKYSSLNSINIAFDTTNAFGLADAGQVIASYNGQDLYSAVYPQCRAAVRADCNDASLQRAINAYLMAIEQDCNTVQTAIEEKQKQMKSAIREGSAMLDLARVENRQSHNSSDFTTCVNEVEAAVLSEEVCGANYHRCLDNGEFIDISTGKPIAGVEKFYELEQLLTFATGVDAANQKLSKISANRTFMRNFENRTKKFAQPALDKCVEIADDVWAEYLDKALLDIYYAQKSKVAEIKQGCFDFVSSCYMNGDQALTDAMKELTGDPSIVLQPDRVVLSTQMCADYINSCNYMFNGNIVAEYVQNRQDTDALTACRAVAKQCFDKYGGANYENFYYPYSGLFTSGNALDWFTLYEYEMGDSKPVIANDHNLVSECARQLKSITSCSSDDMIKKAFGGFNVVHHAESFTDDQKGTVWYVSDKGDSTIYGQIDEYLTRLIHNKNEKDVYIIQQHEPEPAGVATEIYYQIISILSTQCSNLAGNFLELQFIKPNLYKSDNLCRSNFNGSQVYTDSIIRAYGINNGENMCPRDYSINVDTASWGACLCWENGARRSKNGTSPKCVAALPVASENDDNADCTGKKVYYTTQKDVYPKYWCNQTEFSSEQQVCPISSGGQTCGGIDTNTLPKATGI